MDKIKISVIIPIYNAEKTIKKCLTSILNQSYSNIEIILINDGSTDSSLKVCNDFASKDKRILVIDKKNEGSVKARLDGINNSTGDYITFVDSDDSINKKTFELLVNELKKSSFDIICFNSYKTLGKFSIIRRISNTHYFENNKVYYGDKIREDLVSAWMHGHPFPATLWGKIYKRELLNNIGIYSKNISFFYDDLMTNFEVFLRANSVKLINYPFYYYRYGGGSSKYMPNLFDDVINTYKVQKKIIKDYYIESMEEKYKGISIMLLNTLKTCISNIFLSDLSEKEKRERINYFINNDEIIEANKKMISIGYFDNEFINSIATQNINYLYELGKNMNSKSRRKRCLLKILNDLF